MLALPLALQLPQQTVSLSDLAPWVSPIIVTALTFWTKAQIRTETDGVRKDFLAELKAMRVEWVDAIKSIRSEFVPSQYSALEQSRIQERIAGVQGEQHAFKLWAEKRIEQNSDYIHDMQSQLLTTFTGPIDRLNEQMMDKARRMAGYEARNETDEEWQKDIDRKLEGHERWLENHDRRIDIVERRTTTP